MILATRVQRGLRMPCLLDRYRIPPRAQRTSSILQLFGRGAVVPCRHGRAARDSQSAGIPSIRLMRIVPGRPELHYTWARWETLFVSTPPASR